MKYDLTLSHQEFFKKYKRKKIIATYTLGCKVNQYETEAIVEIFENDGYEVVAFNEFADVYLVNTCTVTNVADKKSRQVLNKAKKRNEDSVIIAVGCYVQVAEKDLLESLNIDLAIGNNNKKDVLNLLEEYLKDSKKKACILQLSDQRDYEDLFVSNVKDKTRVFIKIQDGCNQFCSYCIIPFTRGRIRSRASVNIIAEVKELVRKGYKEVVLTGIHLASYRFEDKNYGLIDLIEELDKIQGLKRIRLGSLEPSAITKEFVDRIKKTEKICGHFHLSLQSGCDATLKRMNKKYTRSQYENAVQLLRKAFEIPASTTDIIVGFPGETEEEFKATKGFVERIRFSDIHIFKYSKRQGTKAAEMENQVLDSVKSERSKKLNALKERLQKEYLESFIGKEVEVLTEQMSQIDGQDYLVGHTKNYLKVGIKDAVNVGGNELLLVKVEKVDKTMMIAN